MTEKRERMPKNLQGANINNHCYAQLTPAGIEGYYEHYRDLSAMAATLGFGPIEPLPLKVTDNGTLFQIWKVMNIFGPMLSSDSTELPFDAITFDVNPSSAAHAKEQRTMSAKDVIYVKPTDYGKGILGGAFVQEDIPVRPVEPWMEMTFGEACFVFGPDFFMGHNVMPLEKNLIWLPQ
jgi:hypothetical protein